MLLPRYSLRTTLNAVSICAVFSIVLGQAARGEGWAIVISVAVVSLGVVLLFHALLYVVASSLTRVITAQQSPARTSRGGVQENPDQQSPPTTGPTTGNLL